MRPAAPGRARITFRTRLTLAFTGLVALAGVVIVVFVTVFMRFVPTYLQPGTVDFTAVETATSRVVPAPSPAASGIDSMAQSTGLTLRSPTDILNTSFVVSIVVLVILIGAGALIAWLLAGRMLRPLQAVNAAAQRAGRGSLDHRIGLTGPRDEVRDLADTFDDMLGRLDRSFSASQRFAANASHELQTPLATTQTMLEVALADPDASADELRTIAERVLETNRRSVETVTALLELAELEEHAIDAHPTDLVALARSALRDEATAIASRDLQVHDDLPAAALVDGESVLLRQAASNLIRNAVRHNVDGGSVRLTARARATETALVVENTGPTLDASAVASLAEPFVRAAGRIARGDGHGLGLAIVDSVMRAHGGELRLRARDGGGLIAELVFPRAEPGPATA